MAKLAELRKTAKEMGITPSKIRGAATAEELQSVIDAHKEGGNMAAKAKAKAKSKKRGAVRRTATRADRPKVRGSKSAPARSKGAAKRQATATAKRSTKKRSQARSDVNLGRNLLNGVDFSVEEGWNAREGSPPDRIIRALKRFKGNRDKVFNHLVPDVWDFVGKTMRNGEKRKLKTGPNNAHWMLRYRISRTAFDFAVRTGQHQPSDNRVEYGTGGTGQGVWKPAGKRASGKRSAASKRGSAKRASAKRSTAQKRSQSRAGGSKRKAAKRGSAKRRTTKR